MSRSGSSEAISGAMKTDDVTLPSTCISSSTVPDTSTGIITGGKTPGMLAEAMTLAPPPETKRDGGAAPDLPPIWDGKIDYEYGDL